MGPPAGPRAPRTSPTHAHPVSSSRCVPGGGKGKFGQRNMSTHREWAHNCGQGEATNSSCSATFGRQKGVSAPAWCIVGAGEGIQAWESCHGLGQGTWSGHAAGLRLRIPAGPKACICLPEAASKDRRRRPHLPMRRWQCRLLECEPGAVTTPKDHNHLPVTSPKDCFKEAQ